MTITTVKHCPHCQTILKRMGKNAYCKLVCGFKALVRNLARGTCTFPTLTEMVDQVLL